MGRPKLALPFGPETMLQRVVRILDSVVSPVAVVAAPGQELPRLPSSISVVCDEEPGLGPLGGLAAGLAHLKNVVDAAYVTSCDAPLLKPEFVGALASRLPGHDLVIPKDGRYHHPLAAVYRTHLEGNVRRLIAEKRMRPIDLFEECRTCEVDVEELRTADPQLDSLRNANTPEDYENVLRAAGFTPAPRNRW